MKIILKFEVVIILFPKVCEICKCVIIKQQNFKKSLFTGMSQIFNNKLYKNSGKYNINEEYFEDVSGDTIFFLLLFSAPKNLVLISDYLQRIRKRCSQ